MPNKEDIGRCEEEVEGGGGVRRYESELNKRPELKNSKKWLN